MVSLVVIAATIVPGDAGHGVLIKVGLSCRTLGVAAFGSGDEVGAVS